MTTRQVNQMQTNIETIESILQCNTLEFFDEVNKAVNKDLIQGMNSFQQELITISKSKGYKIKQEDIETGCHHILEKMHNNVNSNLNLFELYVNRNIFVLPTTKNEPIEIHTSAEEMVSPTTQLDLLTDEVSDIRQKYLNLLNQHNTLLLKNNDIKNVLVHMRKTMFKIQQAFPQNEKTSLEEKIRNFAEDKKKLTYLSSRAVELTNELNAQLQSTNTTTTLNDGIMTDSFDNTNLLNSAISRDEN